MEAVFKEVDANIQFEYFRSFSRVRLRCSSPEIADHVRTIMNGTMFMGTTIKVSIAKVIVSVSSVFIDYIMTRYLSWDMVCVGTVCVM